MISNLIVLYIMFCVNVLFSSVLLQYVHFIINKPILSNCSFLHFIEDNTVSYLCRSKRSTDNPRFVLHQFYQYTERKIEIYHFHFFYLEQQLYYLIRNVHYFN